MKRNYTIPMANINGLYSIFFMPVFAYSTVYLLNFGLSNARIGFLLAAANLSAVIVQPLIASVADRRIQTHKTLLLLHILIICAQSLALLFMPLPIWLHATVFAANIVFLFSMQPLINAMAVDIMARGATVNFGIARASSSFFYAVSTIAFGLVLARFDMRLVPAAILVAGIVFFFSLFLFRPQLDPPPFPQKSTDTRTHFFSRYPVFFPVLIGIICVYFNYSMFNSYAIHVVRRLGGGSSQLGVALAIASFAEIPAMLSFNALLRRFGATRLFQVSAVFFGVKTLLIFLSRSISMLYASQAIQALSFGLYSTSSVYFVEERMQAGDRSKGQAFITSAATLGNVLAALLGGFILDHFGVRTMLLVALTFSTIGAALILVVTHSKKTRVPSTRIDM